MNDLQKRIFIEACKKDGFQYVVNKDFIKFTQNFPIKPAFTDEFLFATQLNCDYRSDFCFGLNNRFTALEIDGGAYEESGGGHRSITGFKIGIEKGTAYAILGIQRINCEMKVFNKKPISLINAVKLALGFDIDAKFVFDSLYKKEREKRSVARKKKAAIKKITAAIKPLKKISG